jgi:hypothetical protein
MLVLQSSVAKYRKSDQQMKMCVCLCVCVCVSEWMGEEQQDCFGVSLSHSPTPMIVRLWVCVCLSIKVMFWESVYLCVCVCL